MCGLIDKFSELCDARKTTIAKKVVDHTERNSNNILASQEGNYSEELRSVLEEPAATSEKGRKHIKMRKKTL